MIMCLSTLFKIQLKAQWGNPQSANNQEVSEDWQTPGLSTPEQRKEEETSQVCAFWKVCVNKKGNSVSEGKAL